VRYSDVVEGLAFQAHVVECATYEDSNVEYMRHHKIRESEEVRRALSRPLSRPLSI